MKNTGMDVWEHSHDSDDRKTEHKVQGSLYNAMFGIHRIRLCYK